MTEQDLVIQDLKAENTKLKEQLEQQSKPTEPTDMDKITTEIMEYICDNLCKYPCTCRSEEHLQEVCDECQVEEYLNSIVMKEGFPNGEWIFKYEGTYNSRRAYCSVCGKRSGIGGIKENQMKPYCPNCGAKMKVDEILGGGE